MFILYQNAIRETRANKQRYNGIFRVATTSAPVCRTSAINTSPIATGGDMTVLLRMPIISEILSFGTGREVFTDSGTEVPATGRTAVMTRVGQVHSCAAYLSPRGQAFPDAEIKAPLPDISTVIRQPTGQLIHVINRVIFLSLYTYRYFITFQCCKNAFFQCDNSHFTRCIYGCLFPEDFLTAAFHYGAGIPEDS